MSIKKIRTNYYQHFDADFSRDVPGEGYGGWRQAELDFDLSHTALVVMHAWDCGTREQFPGWHRAVEYIPRSYAICREQLPPLLAAARAGGLPVFHVVSETRYAQDYPGFQATLALQAAAETRSDARKTTRIESTPTLDQLRLFRRDHVFPGKHNLDDIERGQSFKKFPKEAEPVGDEPIAATSWQLFLLCQKYGINHLVYTGFAINYCLWLSPGGMIDLSRRGVLCSTIRQAVTAVENRETARTEAAKELALWYVALTFGFVFDQDDFVRALKSD